MKYCSTCGAEIHENAVVCVKCGCAAPGMKPARQLKTNRGLIKAIILSLLTLGIYELVLFSSLGDDINTVASRHDGKKTMHFCLLAFIVGPLTLGIAYYVWLHNISARFGNELKRRNIAYNFSSADFWLWGIIGGLIVIGPFVYYHKLLKAANLVCADYNQKG